jgi:hypothetical protein
MSAGESKSPMRALVEKQHPEMFWDPADPTKTRLSAKVISLKPSNRKRKSPLPQKWEDVFWDEVVTFAAFRDLSPIERWLLVDLFNVARSIGTDTAIGCSARVASDMIGMGRTSGFAALAALEEKGFIASVRRSRPHKTERVASNWRITFLPFKGNPPTRDYVRRFYKAEDMKAFEATNAKFFNAELEAMWLENLAKYAENPADFDESQWA